MFSRQGCRLAFFSGVSYALAAWCRGFYAMIPCAAEHGQSAAWQVTNRARLLPPAAQAAGLDAHEVSVVCAAPFLTLLRHSWCPAGTASYTEATMCLHGVTGQAAYCAWHRECSMPLARVTHSLRLTPPLPWSLVQVSG